MISSKRERHLSNSMNSKDDDLAVRSVLGGKQAGEEGTCM
jgi:hypothetical protein